MSKRNGGWLAVLAVGVAVGGLARPARAADANATGTWSWEFTRQNGEKVEASAKLKQEGEKVTGTVSGPGGNETEIQDGKIKGSDLSFNVEREFNGNKVVMKYSGKIDGDSIKGKTDVVRDGETRTRDWEAKRKS